MEITALQPLTEIIFAVAPLVSADFLVTCDAKWLQCFLAACDGQVDVASRLLLSYASWCEVSWLQPSSDYNDILATRFIDILPSDNNDTVIAVMRDVRVLGQLLDTYSFDKIVGAHVNQLRHLLESSASARQGVSMVQDLADLNVSLVGRLMDPRKLHIQAQAAHFLLSAFPVRWGTVIVVDAPSSFNTLWQVARRFLPNAFAEAVQFVTRPDALQYCEQEFGRRVL
mmetsp:Transcript_41123/g.68359  ORF Transcript_41123/g.68359 Transcript_41123/m.68359 type:complete len:227 (-) Transcript_41123:139-819(-)|eukprot:CAMPEP_0119316910 /NCGR_PEP_ID=MMETSP1333-20130426/41348_1 /TAXON_ID=418940 /ORGANISM="Scyphosphaera apsteinii, Strain RCC1455" /LENGTH=226 /DNA_ID=CAMNT_0007322689 /DNA_START=32 /DNA_END=712 /DNA_ORIENTATION=-